MDWVVEFYQKQGQWSGCYTGEVDEGHRLKAAWIEELTTPGVKRVLELGAGGGQVSAAMADLGHQVVAIDLVPESCEHARQLAASRPAGQMSVIQGNFYEVEFDTPFDIVCYWDGFGVGTDEEQRLLFKRISTWLTPTSSALIEVGTPWYAASVDGRGWAVGEGERQYRFDADGCRAEDRWWPKGRPEEAVKQTIRCYSPADLRLLAEGTGVVVEHVKPGGVVDWEVGKYLPSVPLERAMNYVAKFGLERAPN